jgi:D-alanine-D-alanine ligase
VEEYIAGREFTVLIAANPDNPKECTAFKPVEYIFPEGIEFKTYALKTSELHPDCNHPCNDPALEKELRADAKKIFQAFSGVGYARMDFRVNDKKEIYFLELNFTCSVFYTDGWDGSADFILKFDGIGQAGFLRHIIAEGIARHKRKQKLFETRGNSISGFGIYAKHNILSGEIIFNGEEKTQRVVTKRYVEKSWKEKEKENFRRYAYPISKEVFILWDEDPSEWAPQNHSCDPNTAFDGLDIVAIRNIGEDEELTLDYALFLDENMEPFKCSCGSANCRGRIMGIKNSSVTKKEQAKKTRRKLNPTVPYIPSISERRLG